MENNTPMKAIRLKCLDCCCGSQNEVKLCPCKDCQLYEYRLGHNPARKGIGRAIKKAAAESTERSENAS